VQELSADRSWRVRSAVIDFTPQLARQLGAEVFDESPELTELCLVWLADPVFAVREAAALNLKRLAEVFGSAWADRVLVPRLLQMRSGEGPGAGADAKGAASFQLRMTTLAAMVTLGEAVAPAVLTARLLPAIAQLARDAVPNVRFNVAKAMLRLARTTLRADAATIKQTVRPCLAQLSSDSDADVRFFAQQALNAL
jgi:serine/threonine-protein phosphatase 2A regulatory subunit A